MVDLRLALVLFFPGANDFHGGAAITQNRRIIIFPNNAHDSYEFLLLEN